MNENQEGMDGQGIEPQRLDRRGDELIFAEMPEHTSRGKSSVLFLLAVVAVVIANICGGLIFSIMDGRHLLAADMLYRIITTALLLMFYAAMLRFLEHRPDPLAAMGLPLWPGWLRETLLGAAISLGLISLAVGAIAIFGHFEPHESWNGVAARRLVEVTILFLFGALMEELMFRGYPFQKVIDAVNPAGAILLFSALFGYVHLKNPNAGGMLSWGFFNTLAIGAVFAVAYLRFKSLWLPFGMHFGWNFALGVLYGLPVSGISSFSVVVRSKAVGPILLTGGDYGIEASLTGAVVIMIGLGIILALPARRSRAIAQVGETPVAEMSPEHPSGI